MLTPYRACGLVGERTTVSILRTAVPVASLLACATLSAEEVSERLVGLDARSVINCMGPPLSLIPLENPSHQLWVYMADLPRPRSERLDPALTGVDRVPMPPSISLPAGISFPYAATGSRRTSRGPKAPDARPGTCRFSFEIRDGVVASFTSVGRRHNGVKADDRCSWEVRKCLPSDATQE